MHSRVIPLFLSLPINQNLRFLVCGHHLGIPFRILKKKFGLCSKFTTYRKNGSRGNNIYFRTSKIHFYYYKILSALILIFMIDPGSRLLTPKTDNSRPKVGDFWATHAITSFCMHATSFMLNFLNK